MDNPNAHKSHLEHLTNDDDKEVREKAHHILNSRFG